MVILLSVTLLWPIMDPVWGKIIGYINLPHAASLGAGGVMTIVVHTVLSVTDRYDFEPVSGR